MARFIALSDGFTDRYIRKGEEFDWTGPKGRWMHPIEEPLPEVLTVPEPEPIPDTNYEMQRGPVKKSKK